LAPDLRLTRRAKRDLQELPAVTAEAVLETLGLIAIEPERMGKRLLGRMEGLWSTRVGHYRVLFTIEESGVVVRAVRHRAVAYRSRRR
jgi:mRNA-degrading endonuclease RelE of RelBE toxin-antitoxin system